ncbi:SET domain-containing protein 5 [Tulasnella sp. 417]|nr:SET domain-containing protein 5 [Tulasnella sp. 417]
MSDSNPARTSPTDADLLAAVTTAQASVPQGPAKKIAAAISAVHPDWFVAEKRVRQILRTQRGGEDAAGAVITTPVPPATTTSPSAEENGGAGTEPPANPKRRRRGKGKTKQDQATSGEGPWTTEDRDGQNPVPPDALYPISQLNQELQVGEWTKKAEVRVFDGMKGKGLVALEDIAEGEVIWKEDPFIYCPDWDIQEAQAVGLRCANCALPLPSPRSPPIPCPSQCGLSWCNRLCHARSKNAHAFLCLGQNHGSTPLLDFVRTEKWIALGALARVVALLLGEWAAAGADGKLGEGKDWSMFRSLAGLSLKERVKVLPNWQTTALADQQLWRRAHKLFVEALDKRTNTDSAKKLHKLKKNKNLPPAIHEELFSYDGFLLGLGKMSLNLESHGALYRLHSHLNHSCSPNVSVQHPLLDTQPAKISVVAKRPIARGEELMVTYVNPRNSLKKRRRELKEWGFGECQCERCLEEEKAREGKEGDDEDDLEDELRGFLGV